MASKLFNRFSTDANKEEAGVWTDFGDGVRIRIRRIRSKKSADVRKELEKPMVDQIRRGPLPEAEAEDLLVRQIAYGVIADWEGVDLGDGIEVPYTRDNAYKLLKALPELRDAVLQVSVDAESFRTKVNEDTEKNSETSSLGA